MEIVTFIAIMGHLPIHALSVGAIENNYLALGGAMAHQLKTDSPGLKPEYCMMG